MHYPISADAVERTVSTLHNFGPERTLQSHPGPGIQAATGVMRDRSHAAVCLCAKQFIEYACNAHYELQLNTDWDRLLLRISRIVGFIMEQKPQTLFVPPKKTPEMTLCGGFTIVNWTTAKVGVHKVEGDDDYLVHFDDADDVVRYSPKSELLCIFHRDNNRSIFYLADTDHGDHNVYLLMIFQESRCCRASHRVKQDFATLPLPLSNPHLGLFNTTYVEFIAFLYQCRLYSTDDRVGPSSHFVSCCAQSIGSIDMLAALFKFDGALLSHRTNFNLFSPDNSGSYYLLFPSRKVGVLDHHDVDFQESDSSTCMMTVINEEAITDGVLYRRRPTAQLLTLFHQLYLGQKTFGKPSIQITNGSTETISPRWMTEERAQRRAAHIQALLEPLFFPPPLRALIGAYDCNITGRSPLVRL